MSRPLLPPKVYLWAWSLYPVLVPFYLMGKEKNPGTQQAVSGVPQIADYYMAGLMLLVLGGLPFVLTRQARAVFAAFAAFAGYATLINLVWAVLLQRTSLLTSALFYIYDTLLLLTCLVLYSHFGDRFLRVTFYSVTASVLLQLALVPVAGGEFPPRQQLFFNNENQLGYYCVLTGTIFALGVRRFPLRPALRLAFYGAIVFLALISQCRAALMGLATLGLVTSLGRPLRLLLLVAGLAAVGALLTLDPDVVGKGGERFVRGGEYDTPATRGYDRIVNYPEYLVFGAGEGAHERFRSELQSEIHSSFGTLLFSYGVVGTALFVAGLVFVCKNDLRAPLYLLPAFVHGTAHHGVRFALFWLMLGFVACILSGAPAAAGAETETA